MKTYLLPLILEPDDEEDGYWYAEVPILPGCGFSCYPREHVLESIQEAAQAMLEVMIEHGDPLPEGLESCEIAPGSEPIFSEKAVCVSI